MCLHKSWRSAINSISRDFSTVLEESWNFQSSLFLGVYTRQHLTVNSFFKQVYEKNELHYYIDGFNVRKSNWMRYVNPAHTSKQQNLVACQIKQDIYFYTTKAIQPNTELLVWYCQEYARRLNYPTTGEQMLLKLRKYILFPFGLRLPNFGSIHVALVSTFKFNWKPASSSKWNLNIR